jgi:hypothetical protein
MFTRIKNAFNHMKFRNLLLVFLCFLTFPLFAQNPQQQNSTGTLTASDTTCLAAQNDSGCVVLPLLQNAGGATISVQNIGSQTVSFEETTDGINHSALTMTNLSTGATATSTTSNGVWQANLSGMAAIYARDSVYASGSATVVIKASVASARTGGGSGGSTSASLNTVGPFFNVQNATYNPNGTVGKGGCATDITTNATSTVTSTAQLTAGTYYGYSPPAIGDIAWVITSNGFGPCKTSINGAIGATSTLRIPGTAATITTITAVNLVAGTVTLSQASATSQANDTLFWADSGDPGDYTAFSSACNAVPASGGTVYAPKGLYVFGTNASGNPTCLIPSTTNTSSLIGDGEDQTLFFPAPWYAHTYNFGSVFAFANAGYDYWSGWTLDGQGIALAYGPDTPAEPSSPALDHVTIRNWNLTSGSTESLYMASSGSAGFHNYVNNSTITASGTNQYACAVSGPYDLIFSNTICAAGRGALEFTGNGGGANLSIVGGSYYNTGVSGAVLLLPVSGTPSASQISISGSTVVCNNIVGTGQDTILLNRTGWTLNMDSSFVNGGGGGNCAPTGNLNGIHAIAGTVVNIAKTLVVGLGTGNVINNAGTINDGGANTLTPGAGITGTGPFLLSPTTTGVQPTVTGTGACATIGSVLGTVAFSGSFACTGVSGAATLTFTWAPNATNKYKCPLPIDVTTGADLFTLTSTSATTCVFGAAAIVASDAITWGVDGQY